MHGLEGEEEKKPKFVPKKCPRCELEKIPDESNFCPRCGAPLDARVAKEVEEAESKVMEAFAMLGDVDIIRMLELVTKLYKIARDERSVRELLSLVRD